MEREPRTKRKNRDPYPGSAENLADLHALDGLRHVAEMCAAVFVAACGVAALVLLLTGAAGWLMRGAPVRGLYATESGWTVEGPPGTCEEPEADTGLQAPQDGGL